MRALPRCTRRGAPAPHRLRSGAMPAPDRVVERQALRRASRHPRSPSPRPARGTAASDARRRPTSVIGAVAPAPSRGAVVERPVLPVLGIVDQIARRGRPTTWREMRSDFVARAGRAPAVAFRALSSTMATILISAPAANRIMDEMRIVPEPECDDRSREFGRDMVSVGSIARQAVRCAKARRAFAGRGACAQRDHNPSAPMKRDARSSLALECPAGSCTVTPCACTAKSSTRVPSFSDDVGMRLHRVEQAACRSPRWTTQ